MPEAALSTLGDALRRRIRLILLVFALGVLGGAALAELTPPTWTAEAQLYVDPRANSSVIELSNGLLNRFYVNQVTSERVLKRASSSFGHGTSPTSLLHVINATVVSSTNVVAVDAQWSSAQGAAALANAMADAAVAQNAADAADRLNSSRQQLQNELGQLQSEIQATQRRVSSDSAAQAALDQAELALLTTQYDTTFKSLQDLQVQRSQDADTVSLLQAANVPVKPSGPSTVRYIAVGAAVGALLGVIIALVVERFDDTLHGPADLALASGIRLIVTVPRPSGSRMPSNSYALAQAHLLARHREIHRLMLVPGSARLSAVGIAVDLSLAAAQAGQRVLLLQPDPNLAAALGTRPGMRVKLPLKVETVGSPATIERSLESVDSYDLVVLAVPPLQLDSTAIAIAHLIDAAVLVAAGQLTRLSEVRETSEQLREAGVSVPASLLVTKTSWGRSWYYPERAEGSEARLTISEKADVVGGEKADLVVDEKPAVVVDIAAPPPPPPPSGNGAQKLTKPSRSVSAR